MGADGQEDWPVRRRSRAKDPQKKISTASETLAFSASTGPPRRQNPSSSQSNSTFEYCGTISSPRGSPDFSSRTSQVL